LKSDARILITGGSGGIGGAIAVACAQRGAWPVVGYCHQQARASQLVRRCGRGEIIQIDLGGDVSHAPPVDALVHCAAAYSPARSLLDASDQTLADLLSVNVLGPLRLTRAVAASGKLKRAVFILSSASFCRGTGPYALSKATELALCRLLANELAPRGVRVDAIVPGWTATAMAAQAAQASGRSMEDIAREHPGGSVLEAHEVGRLCAELLYDYDDASLGRLIVWDRRDTDEPVWHALDDACGACPLEARR
jgi:3-oxoacyl-[acyl-carrier protein] reductase